MLPCRADVPPPLRGCIGYYVPVLDRRRVMVAGARVAAKYSRRSSRRNGTSPIRRRHNPPQAVAGPLSPLDPPPPLLLSAEARRSALWHDAPLLAACLSCWSSSICRPGLSTCSCTAPPTQASLAPAERAASRSLTHARAARRRSHGATPMTAAVQPPRLITLPGSATGRTAACRPVDSRHQPESAQGPQTLVPPVTAPTELQHPDHRTDAGHAVDSRPVPEATNHSLPIPSCSPTFKGPQKEDHQCRH